MSLVEAFGMSNVGCVREANQDSVAFWSHLETGTELAVLADGMGGYEGGGLASSLAVDTVFEVFQEMLCDLDILHPRKGLEPSILTPLLLTASQEANRNVRRARSDYPEYKDMGTTLLAVAMNSRQATIVHAGDSRCYKIQTDRFQRNLKFTQMTRDDSVVQAMLDDGIITPEDVSRIPYRNMLTRALGPKEHVEFTVNSITLQPGDMLLLCSDGFYNAVSQAEISECLPAGMPIQDQVGLLIEKSLQNQADDNTSVVLMKVSA